MSTESRKASLFLLPGAVWHTVVLVAFALGQAACIAVLSLSLATSLANLWAGATVASQTHLVVLVFAGFAGQRLLLIAQDAFAAWCARKEADRLRERLLNSVFVSQTQVAHSEGSAALVCDMIEGTSQVESYLRIMPPKSISAVCITVPLLVCVFTLDWVTGIILLLVFPVVGLYMTLLGRLAESYATEQFSLYNRLANHFIDTLRGLKTLKAFGADKQAEGPIFKASEAFRIATVKTLRVATTSGAALDLICVMGLAAVAIMLAFRLMNGSLSLFIGLACLILSPEVTNPLRAFASDFHASLDGKEALANLQRMLARDKEQQVATDSCTVPTWSSSSELQLKHVSFSYAGESGNISAAKALDDVSLTLRGFEHIAFVGASGSGKSTLASILGGFELPDAGSLYVGSTPMSNAAAQPNQPTAECLQPLPTLRTPSWQEQVLFIPQNPTIFHASLRDNLAFYTPDARDEVIIQAVHAVGLDELVAQLPEGLNTIIGEGARGLSGGQAQRIALARALLDPTRRILIFDEPTAHLDVEVEWELKERMLPLMKDRLVIFCTHRLHWLAQMDRVIVLKNGCIVEQGAPDELLASNGALAHLVASFNGAHQDNTPVAWDTSLSATFETNDGILKEENEAPSLEEPLLSRTSARSSTSTFAWLRPYLSQNREELLRALALGIAWAFAAVGLMFTSGYLISRTACPDTYLSAIIGIIAVVQLFGLGKPVARYFERLDIHDWVFRLTSMLRVRLYRAIRKSKTTADTHTTGDTLGMLAEDIGHLQNLFLRTAFPCLIALALYVLVVLALCVIDLPFGLIAALALGLAVLGIPVIAGVATRGKALKAKQDTNTAYEQLVDNVLGSVDWVLSGRGQNYVQTATHEHMLLQNQLTQLQNQQRIFDSAQSLVLAGTACLTLMWAGSTFASSPNWIAAFTIGFFPLVEFFAPLSEAAASIHAHADSLKRLGMLEDANRIEEDHAEESNQTVLNETIMKELPSEAIELSSAPSVRIDNVSFAYPGAVQPVLHDVRLSIAPGSKTAILGRSGSGKSTLAALMRGDYAPQQGVIRIEGATTDISCDTENAGSDSSIRIESAASDNSSKANTTPNKLSIAPTDLGKNASRVIGILSQQAYLFNRTIRENLTLGVLSATDEQMWDALAAVELDAAIRALPNGLDTLVAEGGTNFSGGQRQRIALARLLLARTPFIILDEPFAALDPGTESALQNTLFSVFADRTLIVITHHLQGIERFDRVVFIENGTVEMEGSPAVLAASNTHFQRLLAFDRGQY